MTRHSRYERQRPEVTVIGAGRFGHAIADKLPKHGATLAVASESHTFTNELVALVDGDTIHAVASDDPTGVEWAGIAKKHHDTGISCPSGRDKESESGWRICE